MQNSHEVSSISEVTIPQDRPFWVQNPCMLQFSDSGKKIFFWREHVQKTFLRNARLAGIWSESTAYFCYAQITIIARSALASLPNPTVRPSSVRPSIPDLDTKSPKMTLLKLLFGLEEVVRVGVPKMDP